MIYLLSLLELIELKNRYKDILEEALSVPQWVPWPEDHYSRSNSSEKVEADEETADEQREHMPEHAWTVFPFLHTFPAYDDSKQTWIKSTCTHCPLTSQLLSTIPGIKTALFSRLEAGCKVYKSL